MVLSGCTTTKTVVVTEYKDRKVLPPAHYLTECFRPFEHPPATYGEAVRRDQAWLCAFERCAIKVMGYREFLGFKNEQKLLCVSDQEELEKTNAQ